MGLVLRHCAIFHIPKTGGKMVRFALACSGIPFYQTQTKHATGPVAELMGPESSHGIPTDPEFTRRPKIGFIRHPATWLQSYWAFREDSANVNFQWNEFDFDSKCRDGEFPGFIDKYLTHYPGFVTRLFNHYTIHCKYIGQQERLLPQLSGGMIEFEKVPIDCPDLRVNKSDKRKAEYSPGQIKAVVQAEEDTIKRYGYPYSIGDLEDVNI